MGVPNTLVTSNIPAQAQITTVTAARNLVNGDTLSIAVGSGTITTAFSGSESATLANFASNIDNLAGVSATATGLTVTVIAEVPGIPFAIGSLGLTNTLTPTPTVNNVAPVAQVVAVNLPTFVSGDAAALSINGSPLAISYTTNSPAMTTSLIATINSLGYLTASLSGSLMILTANVPGVPFTVSALGVTNTQGATIIATNIPPVSQIVTITPNGTIRKWTFRVGINGVNYDYLSNNSDTDTTVVTALASIATASGVTATASGSQLILTANVPGTAFTYSAQALDLTAPAITDVLAVNEILKSGATTQTTLSIDEFGEIYFVQSGSTVNTLGGITNLITSHQAFLGRANAASGVGYTFTIPAGVLDGNYRAVAVDASGNVSGLHTTGITIDNTLPLLTLTTLNQTTSGSTILITGRTEPLLQVSFNGSGGSSTLSVDGGGVFSGALALSPNSVNSITVTSTDLAGNTTSQILTIQQDSINPLFTLTPSQTITNQPSITFTGSTEANALIQITGGLSSVNTTALADGSFAGTIPLNLNTSNTLSILVRDLAGNSSTGSVVIIHDNIIPTVVLSTASGAIVDQNTFQVAGNTEANANLSVLNQSGSIVATGVATNTGSFTLNPTLIQDSTNILTVQATDAAGNTSSASLTVIEDSVANTLLIGALPTATNLTSISITGTTKSSSALILNRTGGFTLTGSAISGNFSLPVPLVSNSSNVIDLRSQDAAGHVATGSVTIIQDSIAPTIIFATAS